MRQGSITSNPDHTWANYQASVRCTSGKSFPGQYYDSESGLHYNYFRDYDPSTGRYVESDPIGLRGGFNTYSYVSNNPLAMIDTLGLASNCVACAYDCNFIYKNDNKDLSDIFKKETSNCGLGADMLCAAAASIGVLVEKRIILKDFENCLEDCANDECDPCQN